MIPARSHLAAAARTPARGDLRTDESRAVASLAIRTSRGHHRRSNSGLFAATRSMAVNEPRTIASIAVDEVRAACEELLATRLSPEQAAPGLGRTRANRKGVIKHSIADKMTRRAQLPTNDWLSAIRRDWDARARENARAYINWPDVANEEGAFFAFGAMRLRALRKTVSDEDAVRSARQSRARDRLRNRPASRAGWPPTSENISAWTFRRK